MCGGRRRLQEYKVISLALILTAFAQVGQPINVLIKNPSFEQYGSTTQGPCGPQAALVPGWNSSLGTGVFVPDLSIQGCDMSAPPDGKAVLLIGPGYSISQDIPAPASQPRGTYLLTVQVANYAFEYQGEYTVTLAIGSLACSASGYAIGQFTQIPVVCSLRDSPPAPLRITLAGEYENLMFDKVSLTFTPLP